MSKQIAFYNMAGGVGKSTLATHVAHALAIEGSRVLLVDCDPQSNSSIFLGVDPKTVNNLYESIVVRKDWQLPIVPTGRDRLDLVPSSPLLHGIGVVISTIDLNQNDFITKFHAMIQSGISEGDYDFVLMDCPPTLELLTYCALACAEHGIVAPVELSMKSSAGLNAVTSGLQMLRGQLGTDLPLLGIVPNRYDKASATQRKHYGELQSDLSDLTAVFDAVPDSYRVLSAQTRGMTLFESAPGSEPAAVLKGIAAKIKEGLK